jgi:hypothetical protein
MVPPYNNNQKIKIAPRNEIRTKRGNRTPPKEIPRRGNANNNIPSKNAKPRLIIMPIIKIIA